MDKEDKLKSTRNNANHPRERSSSRPASHGPNTNQRPDGHGYYDKPGYLGSRETLGPDSHRRYEFSGHHRQYRIPGQVDTNYRQAQHGSSGHNPGASNNKGDSPSDGHRETHQSGGTDGYDDESSSDTGGEQNSYDEDDGYDDGDYDDDDYDDDYGDDGDDYFYDD